MKFRVEPPVFEVYPELFVVIPVITGFDNTKGEKGALAILRAEEKALRERMNPEEMWADERVEVHVEGFSKFGVDAAKMMPAHVALSKRVLEGKELPDINPMVNLYNAMSIKYLTPFGGEDLSSLYEDFVLGFARGGEQWIAIGGGKAKPVEKGNLAWGDAMDVSTPSLNWRQCERTKLTKKSKDGYFIMDAFSSKHEGNVAKAAEEFVERALELFGGEAEVYRVDKDQPEVEVPYETKKWGKKRMMVEGGERKKNGGMVRAEQKKEKKLRGVAREIALGVEKAVESAGWPKVGFVVEHPKEERFGDYSTNVALALAKKLGKSPREVAEQVVKKLASDKELMERVEKLEVAGAGFVNITLTREELVREVNEVMADKWEKPLAGKKISVEYTDPNPFKEFHIGHLYSNLVGESIARLYEATGAEVWRADFYGDVGMHIAKSVWGMMKKMDEEGVSLEDLEKLGVKERQAWMGQGYAEGVRAYEADEAVKEKIKDINYMVYVASQEVLVKEKGWKPLVDYSQYIEGKQDEYPRVRDVYQTGLKWSLAYFETYYARLGTKFDGYYPESYAGELGLQVVEEGLKKGVLTEGREGAVVYEGEAEGLHTRVFRNAMGLPTYEAKDLGLVRAKYADFPFDYSLNIFGKEIDEYYKVVKAAMEKIDPELGKKQEHLAHGMVNLPEGKMSSRKGNVITVEWLLNEARDRAQALMKDSEMSEGVKRGVAEQIGQGAVKFALLKSNIGDNVTFDFGQSVSFEGVSGPYVQYTHARAKSVLSKAEKKELKLDVAKLNVAELGIVRWVSRYPEVLSESAEAKSPSTLAMYLYELSSRFNGFYGGERIVGEPRKEWITGVVAQVLVRGLVVLGIKAPEAM